MSSTRNNWGSSFAFMIAAIGAAVGLGNIWRFPHLTYKYGGGIFILVYLIGLCFLGIPVLISEILTGKISQKSPVQAFKVLNNNKKSAWVSIGWISVISYFIILSYYSVIGGWCIHYLLLSIKNKSLVDNISISSNIFADLYKNSSLSSFYHIIFSGLTISVTFLGIKNGLDKIARYLVITLLLILFGFVFYSLMQPGFLQIVSDIFKPKLSDLSLAAVTNAIGHGFFSLSLGGVMLTYGSYLKNHSDVPKNSLIIAGADTIVSIMAVIIIIPIIVSSSLESTEGPGLVFESIPIAFNKMPGAYFVSILFFLSLILAAITSSIGQLEVVVSYIIDKSNMTRKKATLIAGISGIIFGIPSAMSGGDNIFGKKLKKIIGYTWFEGFDLLVSNILLPLFGIGIAVFMSKKISENVLKDEFYNKSKLGYLYKFWIFVLKYTTPLFLIILLISVFWS